MISGTQLPGSLLTQDKVTAKYLIRVLLFVLTHTKLDEELLELDITLSTYNLCALRVLLYSICERSTS